MGARMEFVGNIVDFGNAMEFHVTNICRAELISPNVVRFSYSVKHILPDGRYENRVVCHLDWDTATLNILSHTFQVARAALMGAPHERLMNVAALPH